jgi:hypothetical protein
MQSLSDDEKMEPQRVEEKTEIPEKDQDQDLDLDLDQDQDQYQDQDQDQDQYQDQDQDQDQCLPATDEYPDQGLGMNENVLKYTKLVQQKRVLLDQKKVIEQALKSLKPLIYKLSTDSCEKKFNIAPNTEQLTEWGGLGALEVRTRNSYQRMNRSNISELCCKFYQFMFPELDDESITKLGGGQAKWMWENRTFEPEQYIERSYVSKNASKRKRTPAKKMVKPVDIDLPTTWNEFSDLEAFQTIQSFISTDE